VFVQGQVLKTIVMELKTHFSNLNKNLKNSSNGFTIIEIVLVTGLILLLATILIIYVHPIENKKKSRDLKRISDIETIDRSISEFVADKKRYPDLSNTLRQSTILPAGSSQLTGSNTGWIKENLSSYISMLPIDPINDATYHYYYIHDVDGYELNAKLEILTIEMVEDGGNDDVTYEIGNNLNLISP
jgi:type II secretory pathway pseudopilin PulG